MFKRFKDLAIKLISMKGLFFITSCILVYNKSLESQYFFYIGVFVISSRLIEKILVK